MDLKTCKHGSCSLYAMESGYCLHHQKLYHHKKSNKSSVATQSKIKITNKYNHLGFKSQIELFKYIWGRKRKCYVTGEDLEKYNGGPQFLSLFAHILSKAQNKHPEFKFYINNIVLVSPRVHELFDKGSLDQILKFEAQHDCSFRILFELEQDIYNEYVSSFGKKTVKRSIVERYLTR